MQARSQTFMREHGNMRCVSHVQECVFLFSNVYVFLEIHFRVHGGDPDSSSILPVLVARAKYPNQWNVLEGVKVEGGNQTM